MLKRPISRKSSFRQNESGAAAVEFAFVGLFVISLLFSMIEIGILMVRISTFEAAVAGSANTIYTGQATTADAIETAICDRVAMVRNCKDNITVELVPIDDWANRPAGDVQCRDAANDDQIAPVVTYQTSQGSEINFMRVCITTDIATPGLGFGLALPKNETGRFELVATTAFMNEPF